MCSRTKHSAFLLFRTKRRFLLLRSVEACLMEMIQVSNFVISWVLRLWCVTLSRTIIPLSSSQLLVLILIMMTSPAVFWPITLSPWARAPPLCPQSAESCRAEKCERGEKIPGFGLFVYQLAGVWRISWRESHPIRLEIPASGLEPGPLLGNLLTLTQNDWRPARLGVSRLFADRRAMVINVNELETKTCQNTKQPLTE